MDQPADIPVLAPAYELEILYRVLQGAQGWMLRDIATPDTALSRVRLAIEWIRMNFNKPMRVELLAEIATLSVSAFHRHFKTVTALSPLQFQKQLHLSQARSLLIAGGRGASHVGFEVGYESASQFSREYARFFGWPPAQDAARIRHALQLKTQAVRKGLGPSTCCRRAEALELLRRCLSRRKLSSSEAAANEEIALAHPDAVDLRPKEQNGEGEGLGLPVPTRVPPTKSRRVISGSLGKFAKLGSRSLILSPGNVSVRQSCEATPCGPRNAIWAYDQYHTSSLELRWPPLAQTILSLDFAGLQPTQPCMQTPTGCNGENDGDFPRRRGVVQSQGHCVVVSAHI